MEIIKEKNNKKLNIKVIGRLDTNTAHDLEKELSDNLPDITDLVLDFEELVYISSSGLRVILSTQKTMDEQGQMTIKNVNGLIMEVFEATGFVDILEIE
ncbi:STAS domain-containing protein [Methanobrevibacter sp. DSM 116169]|uniref:STAS domain-containing protein n=1 Tax=Methanobrevibacter sp. DSM 116169 TaxID=3242727 RepID=UPI0038FCC352